MRNKKLTLIELIITILVLGLLVGLAIPQFAGVKANADVASFKNDIDVLTKAIDESYIKEDSLPLGEKVTITDEKLLDVIYASGDSAANLYKVDLSKTSKYHFDLKTKVSVTDYFIYSKETGKVFYTKGRVDGYNKTLYTLDFVGLTKAKLGEDPLVSGMSVPVTNPAQTITGQVPVSAVVEVKVNGTDLPVTMEDVVFEGNMDLMAAIKAKTFTSEAILSEGSNIVTIKVDSQVTNFKINLGQNSNPVTPDVPIIKPVAVISMNQEQGLTTSTNIVWSADNSTAANGRTITNVEWEGKQDVYTTEGVYVIRLRVKDSTGIWSDWVDKVITVISMSGVKSIETGTYQTFLLLNDGTVKSFGRNYHGVLGSNLNIGKNTANPIPTLIQGISGVKSIAAGGSHTLFLMEDGTVMSFGLNDYGQLGVSTNVGQQTVNPTPTLIPNLTEVESIAAGAQYTIVLLKNGNVMSFGNNNQGQLGKPANGESPNSTPTLILGVSDIKQITAGYNHTVLLKENGEVLSFGSNNYGQLGKLANSTENPTPSLIFGVSKVKNVETGEQHTLLLMEDGTVMSFGLNHFGQLGKVSNGITPNPVPQVISGVYGVKSIVAGGNHTFLLMDNGTVMSFGSNNYGQLGLTANTTPNIISQVIQGVSGVKSISAGKSHTLLLLENGIVMSFGNNEYGQLGRLINSGSDISNPTPTIIVLE